VPRAAELVAAAGSVAAGVQGLLGAGRAETMLYVHDAFDRDTLAAGHIFLSNGKQSEVDPNRLWITDQGIRTGATADMLGPLPALDYRTRATADMLGPLPALDYLVIRIEVVEERDDWRSMSQIAGPLEEALESTLAGDQDKARALLAQARLGALKSTDLTQLDRARVIRGMDAELAAATGSGVTVDSPAPAIERAAARVSTAQARAVMHEVSPTQLLSPKLMA
jgi:hypothetical protein